MKDIIKKEIDRVIKESIPSIPRMIDGYIRDVITAEICQHLNVRYSFGEFKPDQNTERGAFRMAIYNQVAEQFKDMIQNNITDALSKRDMTAILGASRRGLNDAITWEFKRLWAEEMKVVARQEAEKMIEEVKSGLIEKSDG